MRWPHALWIISVALAADGSLDEMLKVATEHIASGEVDKALEAIRPAAKTPEAQFRVARFLHEYSLPWQALAFSAEARAALPRRADVALLHGSILNSTGRFEEAVATLEPLLSISNAPLRLRILLAQAYLRTGKQAKAIAELRQACDRFPHEPELTAQLAFAYLRAAEPDLARITLREAKPSVEMTAAMIALASAALRDGEAEAAELVLAELNLVAPKEQIIILRANLLCLQEKPEEAIALLSLHPTLSSSASGALATGMAHYQLGRFREALELFSISLAKAPASGAAEHHLGLTHANLGRYSEAEACHRRAIAAEPRNALYRFQLGWVLLRLNRAEDAKHYLRTASELNPQFAQALTELGRLTLDEGKPEEAIEYFKRAVHSDPQFDQPYLLLSTACRRLDRRNEAHEWLQKFQALKQQERDSRARKHGM